MLVSEVVEKAELLTAKEPTQGTSSNRFLYLMTFFAAIGGFLFGYDTGVISGALLLLDKDFDLTDLKKESVVSLALVGAIIGALIAGWSGDRFGRRIATGIASILFTLGSLVLGLAMNFEMLIVGRFIVGLGIGMASNIVPVYVAEIAPAEKRGALVTVNNLAVTGGQFISYLIDSAFADVSQGWRYMLGIAAIPAIIQLFGLIFLIPESPRWLMGQSRDAEAVMILKRIRGKSEVQDEIAEIQTSLSTESGIGWIALLTDASLRPALVLGIMLQVIQQFAGINTAMYYSATIIKLAGFTDNATAIWLSTLIAFTNAVFTVISIFLIDRIGRRFLLLASMPPTTLFLFAIGFAFWAQEHLLFGKLTTMITGLVALDSLALYVAFFAIGLGPSPWAVNSEIYPLQVRSKANAIATTMNWAANLVISMTFLSFARLVTRAGTFWVYGGLAILAWIYLYFKLPETMGMSMEEIQHQLRGGAVSLNNGSFPNQETVPVKTKIDAPVEDDDKLDLNHSD